MSGIFRVTSHDLERMRLAVWAAGKSDAPAKVALGADLLELILKHLEYKKQVTVAVLDRKLTK